MRGGTSRGPYFNAKDLPADRETLANVLVSVLGSGQPNNIDGMGGGTAVTTKVAILSKSNDDWADIDYFFAQVSVDDQLVDFKPSCGNMLSGVGPAAIEMGLYQPTSDTSDIRIRAVNTGARIVASLITPNAQVTYEGDATIAGVNGTAAPIQLKFMEIVGAATGEFLPTGKLVDVIDGIEVTCMDVAMPMAIARAEDFGLSGYESATELDANKTFFAKMEQVRCEAGRLMGMGDVSKSVTPKFGLVSAPRRGGSLNTRYFMPWNTHPSMAVTGAQCLATCLLTPGTVANNLLEKPMASPAIVTLEHPSGQMDVAVEFEQGEQFKLISGGTLRTARKIADGQVYVPSDIWNGGSR